MNGTLRRWKMVALTALLLAGVSILTSATLFAVVQEERQGRSIDSRRSIEQFCDVAQGQRRALEEQARNTTNYLARPGGQGTLGP